MKKMTLVGMATATALWGLGIISTAGAGTILGTDPLRNHMTATDSQCSADLTWSMSDLTHNPRHGLSFSGARTRSISAEHSSGNNPFGIRFTPLTTTNENPTGAWGIFPGFWDAHKPDGAIGYTLAMGNESDQWVVFNTASNAPSGKWTLNGLGQKDGDLVHVHLYRTTQAPEPMMLGLLGLGLLGMMLVDYRRRLR